MEGIASHRMASRGMAATHLFSPLDGSPYSASGSSSTGFSRDRRPDGILRGFLCIAAVLLRSGRVGEGVREG